MRIDGRPNQRACLTPVRDRIAVAPQNLVVDVGPDPTRLVDKVMRKGMDHHHFMVRPRIVNQAMQAVARELTGLGSLPDEAPSAPSLHREHAPDVLVVGAGAAGNAATEVLGAAGLDVLQCERAPADPNVPTRALHRTGVFGVYRAERIWAAVTDDGVAPPTLHTIRPRHVLLCPGARDPTLLVRNNDLPGVVAARGLLRQLMRADARLVVPVVVVGVGEAAQAFANALSARCVPTDRVRKLAGGRRVEAVVTETEHIEAQLVAFAPAPAPAHDLPRQAGATLHFDGAGFATSRDDDGRATTDEAWTVWAAGDVSGFLGPAAAADDGRRVAHAIVRATTSR